MYDTHKKHTNATANSQDHKTDVEFFYENGFMGPFKLYEPEEAKEILHQIRIKNLDKSNAVFDNDVNYDRHLDISELSQHVCHPGIVSRLREIIGANILCWRTEFFPKFPGSAGTEWHQVSNYQYATGKPMLVPTQEQQGIPFDLTVWTTFTEATKENGCMKFLPGTHKKLYYDESKRTAAGRQGKYRSVEAETLFYGYNFEDFKIDDEWSPSESDAVAMEMQPGECVIFTARCIHASFPNTSKRSTRFAISARYVPTHVEVYKDMHEFDAHGGHFVLDKYGTVLVSGKDEFQHNTIKSHNELGEAFKTIK